MTRSVLICSAARLTSDGRFANVGDEALTQCLAEGVRRRFPGVAARATLNVRQSPAYAVPPGRVPVRPVRRLARQILAADVVMIGGGTLVQEEVEPRPFEPVAGLLRYLTTVTILASAFRKPTVIVAIGAEELQYGRSRAAARFICRRAAAVSARDAASATVLRNLADRDVAVVGDPLFLSGDAIQAQPPATPPRRVAVSLRPDAPRELVRAVAEAIDDAEDVQLVAMDRERAGDVVALERLRAAVDRPARCRLLSLNTDWRAVVAELAQADLCIGMRLHFLIFAALAGRPSVALTSSPKTVSFAAEVGLAAAAIDAPAANVASAVARATPAQPSAVEALRGRAWRALDPLEAWLA